MQNFGPWFLRQKPEGSEIQKKSNNFDLTLYWNS